MKLEHMHKRSSQRPAVTLAATDLPATDRRPPKPVGPAPPAVQPPAHRVDVGTREGAPWAVIPVNVKLELTEGWRGCLEIFTTVAELLDATVLLP